jgi:hypothetical protein
MLATWWWTRQQDKRRAEMDSAGLTASDRSEIKKITTLEHTLNTHLLDCAKANGALDVKVDDLLSDVSALTRNMGQLQAQIRNVSMGVGDTIFVKETPKILP